MSLAAHNRMKMYLALREWIEVGMADIIYDSPFQTSEYAPYVVISLLKKTPTKHIPGDVLDQLEQELVSANIAIPKKTPPWYKRIFLQVNK